MPSILTRPSGGGSSTPDPNRTPWVSNPVNANDDSFGNIYNFTVARLAAQIPASTYSALDFKNDIIQRNADGNGNYFGYVTPANAGGITGFTGILTNNTTQWTIRVNGSAIMTLCNPQVDKDIIVKVERLASGIFKFYKGETLVYTSTYSDAGILVPTAVASYGGTYMSEAHISV